MPSGDITCLKFKQWFCQFLLWAVIDHVHTQEIMDLKIQVPFKVLQDMEHTWAWQYGLLG